ncbi:MAG: mannose-1-phosphate guanylyltransferase [Pirellulales bacterium]|nr:mannose-1-phosphate guanylyltransferase [Pirellulales bacterium]
MLHALIMAGGAGTRFWPESRAARPKQLLKLAGERSMLQATFDRLLGLVPRERICVATAATLVPATAEQLSELATAAIVGEPCKRDTAPCIGLMSLLVARQDAEATLLVAPADHVIEPASAFIAAVRLADALVNERPSRIVTFGIKPTYAAESFGYIECGEPLAAPASLGAKPIAPTYQVARFREKPDGATAREYLASGKFFWNSGIFVWRAATIVEQLRTRQPEMVAQLEKIVAAWGTPRQAEVFAAEFAAIRAISIDYAVMEHARDVAVIEAPFNWDDVGSWLSLARLHGADEQGNTIVGRHLGIDTRDTLVRTSDDHLVATLGVSDLLIVHTPDATLVANRHDEEAVRRLTQLLAERGWKEYL